MPLKINTKNLLIYVVYAAALVFMNKAVDGVPLSLGLYYAMLLCGTNIVATPLLYVLASAVHINWTLSLLSLFEAAFLCAITLIYRRTKRKIRYEAAVYIAIAAAPYIAFAPWRGIGELFTANEYLLKSIAAVTILAFAFFCFKTVYALLYRVMRCRLREDELVCCAVVYIALGAGVFNLTGFFVYTALSAAAVVIRVRISRSPAVIICALALAAPPSIISLTLLPLTAYIILSVISLIFCAAGKIFTSVITFGVTSVYCWLFGGFECSVPLIVFRAIFLVLLAAAVCVPSDRYMRSLKNRLLVKEVLPDTAVERSKMRTGEKLYRISEVFREIECAFNALDDEVNDAAARGRMLAELKEKCCKSCDRAKKCAHSNVYNGFVKLIDAGCVKGKVNLIDLPADVTVNCSKPAEVLNALNALLAEYRRFMTESENAKSGRILLADQARGVAEVMKNCAVELSKTHSEYGELEQALKIKLAARGISCPELYVSGDDMEISAVICGRINLKAVTAILSEVTKRKYQLKDKLSYDGEKNCFIFCSPPRYDAAFGVAFAIKNGEKVSGDTHSVIKINEHSFLMALSDGMGSGEYAKKVSSTAISLIEAFYRAEMPEGTVLKTINKLLSFNRDERFTCIDIAAVNLNTGAADFVKIGSPAGIIIREGEIKILESQSLPLGILDSLRPTVCSEQLKNGDIIVFMSDGITSAFPSATDMYEFLREFKPLNPQNLADKILAGALAATGSKVNDDMTVVCTRIFEK